VRLRDRRKAKDAEILLDRLRVRLSDRGNQKDAEVLLDRLKVPLRDRRKAKRCRGFTRQTESGPEGPAESKRMQRFY
jgi:hypothetical protein